MKKLSITIDSQSIPFKQGQSIIEAAQQAGVYIPHLCYQTGFKPQGSCKVCNVEVDGHIHSACTTQACDGQVIKNNTEQQNSARKAITQRLFIEGNHLCPSCEKSGHCDLQALGYHLKMYDLHFPHFFPNREIDSSHPDIMLDRNRCIFCELCVRASRDNDAKNIFSIGGRGINSELIINSPSGTLADSGLDINDRAARICPVGAIIIKGESFETPIGERRYDQHSIADTHVNKLEDQSNER